MGKNKCFNALFQIRFRSFLTQKFSIICCRFTSQYMLQLFFIMFFVVIWNITNEYISFQQAPHRKNKTKLTNIFYFSFDQTRSLSNKQRIEMWKYPVAKIYPIAFWYNKLWHVMCISIKIYYCFLRVCERDNIFSQNRYNKINICMCVGVWRVRSLGYPLY